MLIVLFDVDGTLIRSGGAGKTAMYRALQQRFGVSEVADTIAFGGRTDRAITVELLQMHGIAATEQNVSEFWSTYWSLLPETMTQCPGEILVGVNELLEQLCSNGSVAVGLLTGNTQRSAKTKLNHFGLDHYFEFGGFGEKHSCRSELAKSLKQQLAQSYRASETWVIGDTPNDVRCGRAISAKCLAVCTGWCSREELVDARPDRLLDSLADTEQVLRILYETSGRGRL